MKGLVLAAGQAQRLRPLTADLPKTLLPVAGDATILDLTLANLRAVGIEEAVDRHRLRRRADRGARARAGAPPRRAPRARAQRPPGLEQRVLALDRARGASATARCSSTATRSTPSPSRSGCSPRAGRGLLLAVDDEKTLGDEEMKVLLSPDGDVQRINKAVDPPPRRASTSA